MPILTNNQIQNLHRRYRSVVNFINTQNEQQPDGLRIKQVQLPSSMTQSLAYHFIVDNPDCIGVSNIVVENLSEGNNKTYDLIYQVDNGVVNIEVKATGTRDFQRFRPHALTANYVIWLNFNDNSYDIAIFNPNILNPGSNNEVDITWRGLIQLEGIRLINNRIIE